MTGKTVVVFAKAPRAGFVKTRLAKHLNADLVLDLYKAFVRDTLDAAGQAGTPVVYFRPAESAGQVKNWLGREYDYALQTGKGLGERMANAFEQVFQKGGERVLLVGTDVPQVNGALLNRAFAGLDGHDAVIGPSSDGGYYLIGFRKDSFAPAVFACIDWSTDRVLDQTLAAMCRQKMTVARLTEFNDVDTLEDLKDLVRFAGAGNPVGERTRQVLTRNHFTAGIK